MKLLSSVLVLVLTFAAVACSDAEDDPTPEASATAVLAEPTATSEPEPTTAPAPTQQPGDETPPAGTTTGIPAIDAVIEDVLAADSDSLVDRFVYASAACTSAQGLGGPPKCSQAPGSPPDGTTVQAFPVSSCELGWTYDLQPIVSQFVARELELFAVLELDLPGPLFDEPGMPVLDHAIIFQSEEPGIGRVGHMLGTSGESVVYLESLCGALPETYFTDRQQIQDHHEVILQGPAFQ